jgi:hypothetical protein
MLRITSGIVSTNKSTGVARSASGNSCDRQATVVARIAFSIVDEWSGDYFFTAFLALAFISEPGYTCGIS